jgi:hypothetical protein
VKLCPIVTKGASTGQAPIQVRIKKNEENAQNESFLRGYSAVDRNLNLQVKGRIQRIRMEVTRATTPPSLLGIDRRMAYANKKYHSGLMCAGVAMGFAGIKLSGSPK